MAKVNEKLMFVVFVKYHWKYKCQCWFILQIVCSLMFINFDIKIQGEMDVNWLQNCWPTFIFKKLCMEATKRFSSELLTLSYQPWGGGGHDLLVHWLGFLQVEASEDFSRTTKKMRIVASILLRWWIGSLVVLSQSQGKLVLLLSLHSPTLNGQNFNLGALIYVRPQVGNVTINSEIRW